MIRDDRNFGRLLLSRVTIGFGGFALPFYVLYGRSVLGMEDQQIGLLVGAQVAGAIVSNVVWAELSDRIGNRVVIRLVAVIGILIPVLALVSSVVVGPRLLVPVFALLGCSASGTGIGFRNYLLEIAPAELRPAYIAVAGTVAGIAFLLPIAGGFVVDTWGYQAAFVITTAVVALGLVFSFMLGCARREAREVLP